MKSPGSRQAAQTSVSARSVDYDDDDIIIFPTDFVVEREDVPILGGIREGSGTILYRAVAHPEWSVFVLRGNWMDDQLHGDVSFHHNTHLLFTASYKYGVLYFKREKCEGGIIITPSGCKPIRAPQHIRPRVQRPIAALSSSTGALVASPVVPLSDDGGEEQAEQPEHEEQLEQPEHEEQLEQPEHTESKIEDDYEYDSDDGEVYEDDVVLYQASKDPEKQVKDSYRTIVNNMIQFDMTTKYAYDEYPDRPTTLYMLSDYKSRNYLLKTQVQNGVPNGSGVLYSMETLQPLCRFTFHLGFPKECFLAKEDKSESDRAAEVLDMNDEGERWEGEIRNLLPNGQGQFFSPDNVCIYEGLMVNGKANGLGTGFYADLGSKAYFGYWENNLRHGPGIEFDRCGAVARRGLWLKGMFVAMETLPNNVNTPHLKATSYSKLVRVMYLNDSSLRGSKENTVSDFPLLKALFLASSCVGESNWNIKDMPVLEKVVGGIRHDGCWCNHYIRFVNCPRLRELWTIVDFAHGTVYLQSKNSQVGRYDSNRFDEAFKPRFVLKELQNYMKWKPSRKPEETDEVRYYLLLKSRFSYLLDRDEVSSVVEDLKEKYCSGKEGGYCSQLSAALNEGCELGYSGDADSYAEYCYEGYLKPPKWHVC